MCSILVISRQNSVQTVEIRAKQQSTFAFYSSSFVPSVAKSWNKKEPNFIQKCTQNHPQRILLKNDYFKSSHKRHQKFGLLL